MAPAPFCVRARLKRRPLDRCSVWRSQKALILAGRTTHDRPWPSIRSGPKHLVPVANRPILFHSLEGLRRSGVIEVTVAIEPRSARAICDALGDGSTWDVTLRCVEWMPSTGVGGALAAARDFVGAEPVLVGPGDALHREALRPHIAAFAEEHLDLMALRLPGAPANGGGEPVAGGYLLSPRATSLLLDRPGMTADPMAGLREQGGLVRVQDTRRLPAVPRRPGPAAGGATGACSRSCAATPTRPPTPPASSRARSASTPPPWSSTRSCAARPSSARARASRTPTSAPTRRSARGVTIDGSQIEHSIVLDRAEILHVGPRLESSVLGRGARVNRSFGLPTAMRLSVGDGAEVTVA